MTEATQAATAFDFGAPITAVESYGGGLINDTFRVLVAGRADPVAILQRINTRVFPEPRRIMENLRVLTRHVAARQGALPAGARRLLIPAALPARTGADYHEDTAGKFWRALEFIPNSISHATIDGPARAGEVGFALGRFHALVHDLDPAQLHITRKGFHNTPVYLDRYQAVLRGLATRPDSASARFCFDFVASHHAGVDALEQAKARGDLPLRIIHGDPKIDNVLFDRVTDRAISLIDLDTVQPALAHYDLGDCLRSACNPAGESPPRAELARFDLPTARAILTHYFAETRGLLTAAELAQLYDAIRLIPFELGLRFFTDYLEGNPYFGVQWPEHNLLRAETQFRLAASIEAQTAAIHELITDLTG